MTDEVKKKKTVHELMNTPLDELTTDEIERRVVLLKAQEAELNAQDLKDRVDERKNKRQMISEQFRARGRELKQTLKAQETHQNNCSHRKGGRGLEAIQKGGTASDFAVIRHLLPNSQWWQRCQRCGKTWRPPNELDFDLKDSVERTAFDAAKKEYQEALSWPTDNIPSTGITFQHHSEDNDVSAREFTHEVWKNTTLR
jgi:uncharacterized small protein (DUF1192 family)